MCRCRRVFDAERGVSVSLVENATRSSCIQPTSWKHSSGLVDEGKTARSRPPTTYLTVERRLKLARLAPEFLDMYRADQIEMGQLQALALTDDHEEQRRGLEYAVPAIRTTSRRC